MRAIFILILTIVSRLSLAQCDTTGVLLELQATTNIQGILVGDQKCIKGLVVIGPLYISNDTLMLDTTGLGGGGGSIDADNGVSDNEAGGKIRLGNRYMGTPDAPFTDNRKVNVDGRFLYVGDLSDSTLLVADGSSDRVGIGTDLPARKLDVNGEVRIRDLTTDTPTLLLAADGDGDLASLGVGTNLQITGGNLAVTGLSYQGLRDNGTDETKRVNANFISSGRVSATLTDDGVNNETEIVMDVIDNSISNAKIRQGAARSVIGVTGNAAANVADIQGTADQVLRVNTAGTALAFGQVATGGILDDAVTYAKIQNVVNDDRFLGRISGANGIIEELTRAQAQTILGMTGVVDRFALWTANDQIGSDAAFTFNGATDRATFTGTTAGIGANTGILNLNAGAIAGAMTFLRMSGNINGNMWMEMLNSNTQSADNHTVFLMQSGGANAGDALMQFSVNGQMTHSIGIDNTDDRFKITPDAFRPGEFDRGITVRNNAGTGNVGINNVFPTYPLTVEGRTRSDLFMGEGNAFTAGNVAFGNGAGTGPTLTEIVGTGNGFYIKFSTGTTPTANGVIFTLTYPTAFITKSFVTFSAGADGAAASGDNAANDFLKFKINESDAATFEFKAVGTLQASTAYALTFNYWGY